MLFAQYMEELLRSNENMEFFIEGGRTRTGKAGHPKGGLLSVLVESFNNGQCSIVTLLFISLCVVLKIHLRRTE